MTISLPSYSPLILLALILMGEAASAQVSPAAGGLGARRIELAPEAARAVAEVMVSPGLSTVFNFDSELLRDGLELDGRERFALVDVGQSTLRLVPSERILSGERLRLMVRFRDGAEPGLGAFVLVVQPAQPEMVVEVYRKKRTVETYRQEAHEARIEAERLRDELKRMRAECRGPGGLAGLISMELMGTQGVERRDLGRAVTQAPGSALMARAVYSFRTARRVAVEVWLELPDGSQPWIAKGASIRSKSGEEMKVLQVWQDVSVTSEKSRRVAIEAESTADAVRGPFTLKLWEADGPRTVTLGNVTFP
ncbi:DUF2381 family protein [Myxococcus sp. QH3KD-4-1]|nr:DUF2381 family protein [Myxococcus qinghaiensis]